MNKQAWLRERDRKQKKGGFCSTATKKIKYLNPKQGSISWIQAKTNFLASKAKVYVDCEDAVFPRRRGCQPHTSMIYLWDEKIVGIDSNTGRESRVVPARRLIAKLRAVGVRAGPSVWYPQPDGCGDHLISRMRRRQISSTNSRSRVGELSRSIYHPRQRVRKSDMMYRLLQMTNLSCVLCRWCARHYKVL